MRKREKELRDAIAAAEKRLAAAEETYLLGGTKAKEEAADEERSKAREAVRAILDRLVAEADLGTDGHRERICERLGITKGDLRKKHHIDPRKRERDADMLAKLVELETRAFRRKMEKENPEVEAAEKVATAAGARWSKASDADRRAKRPIDAARREVRDLNEKLKTYLAGVAEREAKKAEKERAAEDKQAGKRSKAVDTERGREVRRVLRAEIERLDDTPRYRSRW